MSRASLPRVMGMGAHTCVGATVLTTAMMGRARLLEPTIVGRDAGGDEIHGLRAVGVSDEARGLDRYAELCAPALAEAIKTAASRPKLIVCLPELGRPGAPQEADEVVLAALVSRAGIAIDRVGAVVVREGRRGWTRAATLAHDLARAGHDVLVGGADVLIDPRTIAWLASNERTMADSRSGMVPSEASGFLLLGSGSGRVELGGIDLVRGIEATAGALAVAEVLRSVAIAGPFWLLADTNGEEERASGWADVEIALAPAELARRDDTSQLIGEVGTASGPVLAAMALAWMRAGCAPAPRACIGLLDDDASWSLTMVQA